MVLSVDRLLWLVAVATIVDCRAIDPRCQPMRIPWCLGVYDAVYFPNHLQHQSQEEAYYAMHKLWPLIQTECSPQILHYLCRLYAPQCPFVVADRDQSYVTYHAEQYLPPCEDACAKVRYDCHSILAKHHIEWPAELECSKLRDKSCFETPQIEIQSTTEKSEMLEPETKPAVVAVPEEMTTEPTIESTTIESPEEASQEDDEVPTEVPEISTHGDGLIDLPSEEETTSHATVASPEPVTEPDNETDEPTEEEGTPMPIPDDGDKMEETTEPAITAEPESPLSTIDTTTGSLLGISGVIVEDTTAADDVHDASGDDEEISTTAVAVEHDADTVAVDAAHEPTAEELTTSSSPEIIAPTVDPPVAEGAPANDDLSSTPIVEPANESPRSDRATGSTSGISYRKPGSYVEMMIIYLATLSLIFHRGA